jgi:hypothetical protein
MWRICAWVADGCNFEMVWITPTIWLFGGSPWLKWRRSVLRVAFCADIGMWYLRVNLLCCALNLISPWAMLMEAERIDTHKTTELIRCVFSTTPVLLSMAYSWYSPLSWCPHVLNSVNLSLPALDLVWVRLDSKEADGMTKNHDEKHTYVAFTLFLLTLFGMYVIFVCENLRLNRLFIFLFVFWVRCADSREGAHCHPIEIHEKLLEVMSVSLAEQAAASHRWWYFDAEISWSILRLPDDFCGCDVVSLFQLLDTIQ